MNTFSRSRKIGGVILAAAAGMFAIQDSRGERAYLPVVGCPPLRFQAAETNHLALNLKSFLMMMAAKRAEASNAVAQLARPATNELNIARVSSAVSESQQNANHAAVPAQAAPERKNNPETTVITPISTSSASDMLTVTPQMITEYLKPGQNQTQQTNQNGGVLFVPAEMQLAPASPGVSGASQATYKSQ